VNPFGICTWGDEAECEGCELRGRLNCRWSREALLAFIALIIPFAVVGVPGMYVAGVVTRQWLPQAGFAAFIFVFFTALEARLLCRHCPFYARTGFFIRCYANHGLPKLWGFQPEPANRWEKGALVLCFAVIGVAPVLIELNGLAYLHGYMARLAYSGLIIATFFAIVSGFARLGLKFCPRCVNFSCPFNMVSRELREKFLDRNPVLRAAWSSLD